MGLDLRLPNITAQTEREQLSQIKSYLYQLASQLQWALNASDISSASRQVVVQTPKNVVAQSKEEDVETTFNSLKPLIIKSAEIVEAYYDEISYRLDGSYVATSDFGTYAEETSLKIQANSESIGQHYKNIQDIATNLANLDITLSETNAHIKSGELYTDDDGLPVYGLEIGQRNTVDGVEVFDKFARFTSDRLSFYDQNGSEVAYLSDYTLYIRGIKVLTRFEIGGFIDTVMSNGDVVEKWVGGEG